MHGKVIVITGATSGIGQVAAERLAAMGARLVLVARDEARGEAALTRLAERAPGLAHTIHYADLSRLAEMRRVATEIAAAEPRIDVLINNAGALFNSRHLTEDGLERTFALNHMAYFVLTHGLRERLAASAPAKVYGRSKLCNILYTRELAHRLAGTGITANCLHPGFVATRFGDESGRVFSHVIRIAKLFAISPEKGADTIVHLAASPEVADVSGGYFYKRRPATPSDEARDAAAARRLWEESTRLAGIEGW